MGTTQLNETFTDDEHDALSDVKGDRTWRLAILEEFGVESASGDVGGEGSADDD